MSLVLFKNVPVSVKNVVINGNERTRDTFIKSELKESMESTNMRELYSNLSKVTSNMRSLGIYESLELNVETCKGDGGSYDVDLVVNMKEKGIPMLKVSIFSLIACLCFNLQCRRWSITYVKV